MTTLDTRPKPAGGELLAAELLERCRQRAAGYDQRNEFFSADFAELRAAGYLSAALPTGHGGAGAGLDAIVDAQRRLAAAAPATALAMTMHMYFTGTAAQLHAEGDPAVGWILDEAARGEIFAAGHAETGNDLPVLLSTTQARRVAGGYRITGRKRFGSLGPVWTRLGIHALDTDAPGEPRVVHAFVERDASGVAVQEHWDALGMRATQSYDTVLDDVFVPDHRVVRTLPAGDPTDTWFGVMAAWAFLEFGAVYTGIAERALDIAVHEATTKTSVAIERRTLAHNPHIQDAAARMYLDALVARTIVDTTAGDWTAGVEHPDWPTRILAAKHVAVERAKAVVDRALEVAGGGALARGHELERLYRDIRAGWFNGINGHLTHELIGKSLLGVRTQSRW